MLAGIRPNVVIASRGGLSCNDFLVHLAPFTAVLLAVFTGLSRFLFGGSFRYDPKQAAAVMAPREREAIRDVRLLAVGLGVAAAVTAGFVLQSVTGLEPAVVALAGPSQARQGGNEPQALPGVTSSASADLLRRTHSPRATSCRTIGQFWRVSAGGCAARSFGRAGLPVPHGSPDSFGPNPATVAEFPGPTVLS